MNWLKIIQTKPSYFLIGFIGLIPILFLTVAGISKLFGQNGISFALLIFFGGFFGYFMFWLLIINNGLDYLNAKHGIPSKIKKNKRLIIVLISSFAIRLFIALPPLKTTEGLFVNGMNIALGLLGLFSLIYLVHNITEDYVFHVKGRVPNIFDYFIVLFHLGFYPIGLLMLHSHVRLLMRDENIIDFE